MSGRPGERRTRAVVALVVVIACLVSVWPSLGPGIPRGHDTVFELVRIAEYGRALAEGVFPPRWASNFFGGFGYPIFVFFPPVFSTIGGGLVALGTSETVALESGYALLALVGAFGMFRLVRLQHGAVVGAFAAAVYVLAPYRFFDAWVRSASAELAAISIAPWVALAIQSAASRSGSCAPRVALGALALSAFALSHVLSNIMFLPVFVFVAALALVSERRRGRSAVNIGAMALLAAGLGAFHLLPLIARLSDLSGAWAVTGGEHIAAQLLDGSALFDGGFAPTALWLVVLWGVTAAGIHALGGAEDQRDTRHRAIGLLVLGLIGALLATRASAPLWERVESLHFFLYPWRWLAVSSFCAVWGVADVLGGVRRLSPERGRWGLAVVGTATVAAFALSGSALGERWVAPTDLAAPERLRTARVTTTVADEYVPRTVTDLPGGPATPSIRGDGVRTREVEMSTHAMGWEVAASEPLEVELRRWWFPGWVVRVDGTEIPFAVTREGTIAIRVPDGTHTVDLAYEGTGADALGLATSGISAALVLALLGLSRRRRAASEQG